MDKGERKSQSGSVVLAMWKMKTIHQLLIAPRTKRRMTLLLSEQRGLRPTIWTGTEISNTKVAQAKLDTPGSVVVKQRS